MKNLFKYRNIELGRIFRVIFTLYLFQRDRWELGITLDLSKGADPLLCFNFIFIFLEVEYYTKAQEQVDKDFEKRYPKLYTHKDLDN